jgi:alkyl sulfatase BDS1-like metallo-beta-lactamase superfamily hydrolase
VPPSADGVTVLRLGSYALTLKTFFRPDQARGINETYALYVGNEVLQVEINEGAMHVQQATTRKADVAFHTDMPSYLGLLQGQIQPDEAVSRGLIRIEGDPDALRRFLNICGMSSTSAADDSVAA